jgi:hypothetical protein
MDFDDLYTSIGDHRWRSKAHDLLEFDFIDHTLSFFRFEIVFNVNEVFDTVDDMKVFMSAKHDYFVYIIQSVDRLFGSGFSECLLCDGLDDTIFPDITIRGHIDEEHPFDTSVFVKSAHKS